jgi:hypothetical protein
MGLWVGLSAGAVDCIRGALLVLSEAIAPVFLAAAFRAPAARFLVALAGQAASLPFALQDFGVSDLLHRIKCPVLVVGTGQDRLIPSSESMHVAASLGDLATLIWYEQSGHCAYDQIDDWMEVAAQWLFGAFGIEPVEHAPDRSTQVDAVYSPAPAPRTTAPPVPAEDVVISVDAAAVRRDDLGDTPDEDAADDSDD